MRKAFARSLVVLGVLIGSTFVAGVLATVYGTVHASPAGALSSGEGSGSSWCATYGGTNLVPYDTIFACYGPSASPTPFDGQAASNAPNSQTATSTTSTATPSSIRATTTTTSWAGTSSSSVAAQYGISTGSSGSSAMPVAGDIISMWGGTSGQAQDGDDTHVAVVTAVSGDSITTLNQNDVSDSNGDNGFNMITVSGSEAGASMASTTPDSSG